MRTRPSIDSAVLGVAALLALVAAGCGTHASRNSASTRAAEHSRAASSGPLAGRRFFVVRSPADHQIAELQREGQTADAHALERLAAQPTATWMTGSAGVLRAVQTLTMRALAAGRSTLLVAYDIPGRDCGGYSAGGAPSATAYRRWIERLADGIANRPATVILEPDAIPQMLTAGCSTHQSRLERLSLLQSAIATLRAHANTTVYLDAGNPGWIRPADRLVRLLRLAGIGQATGFALNVSNFYDTATVLAYGESISRALGGTHFVIDTSRNGNGAPPSSTLEPSWCNPPGRALGADPTTDTGDPLVDAFLWVKQPGVSDGTCHPGDPPAGSWLPTYALALALAKPKYH